MKRPQPIKSAVSNFEEINALPRVGIDQLRRRYTELHRRSSSRALGPDLLRKSIAHEIQTRAHGGLPPAIRKLLQDHVKRYRAQPNHQLKIGGRIKIGSEFARTWKGKMHRAVVLADGFGYAGKTYKSLSEIATLIAGSRWNGPRFFGLRGKS